MFHLIPYRNINNSQLPLCHEWHWRISWKKMQKWCITKKEKCFSVTNYEICHQNSSKNVIWPNIWSKNIFWSKIWRFVPNLMLTVFSTRRIKNIKKNEINNIFILNLHYFTSFLCCLFLDSLVQLVKNNPYAFEEVLTIDYKRYINVIVCIWLVF